jgi:hypothetical protein
MAIRNWLVRELVLDIQISMGANLVSTRVICVFSLPLEARYFLYADKEKYLAKATWWLAKVNC